MVKSSDVDKVKDSSVRAVRLRHCNYGIDYIVEYAYTQLFHIYCSNIHQAQYKYCKEL